MALDAEEAGAAAPESVLWRGLAGLFLAGLRAEISSESGRSNQNAERQEMEVSSPRGVVHGNLLLRCA